MYRSGIAAAVVLVLLAAGAVWFARSPSEQEAAAGQGSGGVAAGAAAGFFTASDTMLAAATTGEAPATPPPGSVRYASAEYGFSLYYPQDLAVKTYDEGDGASTFVFEDVKAARGFEIFVVPYGDTQVTTERFAKDEPSGVMQSPQPLSIDGTTATMFYGRDSSLGPTREVWFIRGGYLYQVTAPKSLDDWLGQIMLTWRWG